MIEIGFSERVGCREASRESERSERERRRCQARFLEPDSDGPRRNRWTSYDQRRSGRVRSFGSSGHDGGHYEGSGGWRCRDDSRRRCFYVYGCAEETQEGKEEPEGEGKSQSPRGHYGRTGMKRFRGSQFVKFSRFYTTLSAFTPFFSTSFCTSKQMLLRLLLGETSRGRWSSSRIAQLAKLLCEALDSALSPRQIMRRVSLVCVARNIDHTITERQRESGRIPFLDTA